MAVYVVLIRERVDDQDQFAEYRKLVPASFEGIDIVPIAQSRVSGVEVLEGPDIEGMAITKFPSMEAARTWFDSPEYCAAREKRAGIADVRILVAEETALEDVDGLR